MQIPARWQSCTENQMQRKSMHPWACLHIITVCTHMHQLPWWLCLGYIPKELDSLRPPHHPFNTHTHTHSYCNSRKWATDVPTEVFEAFYHAKVPLGLIQMDCSDKNMLIMATPHIAGRGDQRGQGYSDDWIGGWINGLMEKWLGVWVVREDRGGRCWDPKRCSQDQMAFVCDLRETHTHTEFW